MNNVIFSIQQRYLKCVHSALFFALMLNLFGPINGWAQSFSDTGSFSFTGSHNPVNPILVYPQFRRLFPGKGVKAGPVRLHPFLGVAEVYTDNVFRTEKRRRGDFLTTIAPGLQASLPIAERHKLIFDYRAAQFLYGKFSENNVLTQDGLGRLSLDFPSGLKVDFQAEHVEGFDPRGSELDIQQQDITKWRSDLIKAQAEMIGSKVGLRIGVSYARVHFKNNDQAAPRDRSFGSVDLTVIVPANENVSALFGAQISDESYDENTQLDSFSYGIFTGFRLAANQRLSGEFNLGYSVLNFDRSPVLDPVQEMELTRRNLSVGGKHQELLFMRGDLRWRPTSQLDFRLVPFRFLQQSAVFNTSTFTQTGLGVSALKVFTKRFSTRGSFLYANSDFAEARNDDRFRWRIELDYRTVKWLGFKLAYSFERRASSQNQFDFYSNTIMFSVQGLL
ncbi:MAG: hypothetical protein NPIRA04_25620 [Nitrospirales bacterium]|nr:MAG: hypothetical protein NPIRA04_25620 [Nitrospirales bacterium]